MSARIEADDEQDELLCIGCNGSGEGMHDGSRCSSCDGSGVEGSLERRREAEEERAEYLAQSRKDDELCHRYYDGT
jgi:DnaJ-class molecular chaperone